MEQKKTRTAAKKPAASAAKKSAPRRTKKQQGDVIFALDIGTRTVVGVLAEKKSDGSYKLLDMETQAHESRSMNDGQIEDIEAVAAVAKSVKAALERRQLIKLSRVCIAAAGRALRTMRHRCAHDVSAKRVISADDIRSAELEAVRSAEEKFSEENDGASSFYCVGHSVISLELDGYKVSKPEGHRGNELVTEIIAAFLPAYVVESLCAAVDLAGLETAGLTLEPIAAINAIVPPELRLINIVMCDIGAGTSDVAVSRDGSITAYGMATVAGDEMTEELMKRLLVDFGTAERIKTSQQPETEYTDILLTKHTITAEQVTELLRPAAERLAQTVCAEILKANGEAPQAVFLVGGGSKLAGLAGLVAKGLGLPPERAAVGSREMIRGITAPASIKLGCEHATPIGIAITASEGVKYDFTTVTLNGRKIRALDTRRLSIFELCGLAGIKPEQLMARSGKSLSYTADGEKITLRGTPSTPCEISLNGKECPLSTLVRKGDEVNIVPAVPGEDAAALLSDQYDLTGMTVVNVTLNGRQIAAGEYILVNGTPTADDADIENGAVLRRVNLANLGALLASEDIPAEKADVNGTEQSGEYILQDGDQITAESAHLDEVPAGEADTEQKNGVAITFNGAEAVFPAEDGKPPVFLDILAAFSDDPTKLLSSSKSVTINGKIARLDETIHSGDIIVVE